MYIINLVFIDIAKDKPGNAQKFLHVSALCAIKTVHFKLLLMAY